MPLFVPVIFGGAILAGLGKGASKTKQGIDGQLEARRIVDAARASHQEKLEQLDAGGKFVARRFKDFQDARLEITISTVTDFFEFLKRLEREGGRKQADQEKFSGPHRGDYLHEFQTQFVDLAAMVGGGRAAYAAGAAAGKGAAAVAGAVGTASTGTAIGGLSGAAAQSAFLAYRAGFQPGPITRVSAPSARNYQS